MGRRPSDASLESVSTRLPALSGTSRLQLPKGLPSGRRFSRPSSPDASTAAPSEASSFSSRASSKVNSKNATPRPSSPETSSGSSLKLPPIGRKSERAATLPEERRRFTASELDLQLQELIQSGGGPTIGMLPEDESVSPLTRKFRRNRCYNKEEEDMLDQLEALAVEEASRATQVSQLEELMHLAPWEETNGQVVAKVMAEQSRVENKVRRLAALAEELGSPAPMARRSSSRT